VRYRTYEVLKAEAANPRLRWAYLPYSMHMAGPREAIQHMIIRKNYGARSGAGSTRWGCAGAVVGAQHCRVVQGVRDAAALLAAARLGGAVDATEPRTHTPWPRPVAPPPTAHPTGCTHFIIGRDMAGCKSTISGEDFYGAYDAQELANANAPELGMSTVPSLNIAYTQEKGYVTADVAAAEKLTLLSLSGTKFRKMLR
jgi:hypothetical protein